MLNSVIKFKCRPLFDIENFKLHVSLNTQNFSCKIIGDADLCTLICSYAINYIKFSMNVSMIIKGYINDVNDTHYCKTFNLRQTFGL